YAAILHFRMVSGLKSKWTFNVASMWMIWTIIFTYFGVNYYLSGLHSYAAGDPMPIPIWIPVTAVIMLVLSVASYLSERKYFRKQ
ncbi:MAG TPA: cytochrome C biogenesis protein, partial [Bacteroidales bacterium]|nr:cytochrome C biogenesis protein [Bacteroidales bacterium]